MALTSVLTLPETPKQGPRECTENAATSKHRQVWHAANLLDQRETQQKKITRYAGGLWISCLLWILASLVYVERCRKTFKSDQVWSSQTTPKDPKIMHQILKLQHRNKSFCSCPFNFFHTKWAKSSWNASSSEVYKMILFCKYPYRITMHSSIQHHFIDPTLGYTRIHKVSQVSVCGACTATKTAADWLSIPGSTETSTNRNQTICYKMAVCIYKLYKMQILQP